jgi:hypothetical protein
VNVPGFAIASLESVRRTMALSLDGASPEQLTWRPDPEANPMGWLAWHTARMQDWRIAALAGAEQVWVADGWHTRFEMPADPEDTGLGHTATQVDAVPAADGALLLGHFDAVFERTREYLDSLAHGAVSEPAAGPARELPATVGGILVRVINGQLQHVGQLAYVRGLIEKRRWFPA